MDIIKLSGGSNRYAHRILPLIPQDGKIFCEPFGGSAALSYMLMNHKKFKYDEFHINDINPDLINLHKFLAFEGDIDEIVDNYNYNYERFKLNKVYFHKLRMRFGETRDMNDFLFINRNARSSEIKYDKNNRIYCTYQPNRDGITPEGLKNMIVKLRKKIENNNVHYTIGDYRQCINGISSDAFLYLDPPQLFETPNHCIVHADDKFNADNYIDYVEHLKNKMLVYHRYPKEGFERFSFTYKNPIDKTIPFDCRMSLKHKRQEIYNTKNPKNFKHNSWFFIINE
jgi:site-specific DNA-adenine methylase